MQKTAYEMRISDWSSDVCSSDLSGEVLYAVMSFGGFLGIGEHYHPLPWKVLKYDEERGGYVVGINKDALKDAPRFAADDFPVFDARYGAGVYGYWGEIGRAHV